MAVGGTAPAETHSTSRRHFSSSTNGIANYPHQHNHHLSNGGGGGGTQHHLSKRDQLTSTSLAPKMVSNAHQQQSQHHHHQHGHQHHHHHLQGNNHHPNHSQQQQHAAMLTAQSYYAAAAAASIVNQTTVASNQLLVHHPDYLHPHLHNAHHNQHTQHNQQHPHYQTTNSVYGGPIAAHNNNNNNGNGHHSHSNSSTESSSGSTTGLVPVQSNAIDPLPDRPIGYGAFGVVWSVTDPRDGKVVALKKIPNVFQNLISSRRVFREIKMLSFFKHENVLSALDILQPPMVNFFQEIYVITELMQSDLHKIIVSSQPLTTDHIKVFLYQILRGLKYLHSARILHRDIKPGNLLVNSNCLLKICDFGLARVEEPDRSRHMTQEVVTQYYRAPELLMGARYYTEAIDMWSVGCIFAELLGRRILFQAQTPIKQLDLVTDLLGTPLAEDMKYACSAARTHIHRQPYKSPSLSSLYTLSQYTTAEPVHLLCQMLTFNPDKRISASGALAHSYLVEGRARYHSCMCKCCYDVADVRRYTADLEPTAPVPFDNSFEKELTSVHIVKDRLHKEIMARCMSSNRVPLCINPLSATFKNFASSSVAHPSELPPSPHCWE